MKRRLAGVVTAAIVVGLLVPASQAAANLALDAEVTLHGSFFVGGWGAGATVPGSTITDGVFLGLGHQWDQGPVWWDNARGPGQWIEIDLGGPKAIGGLIVEADNNDEYRVLSWDSGASAWTPLATIAPTGGWGLSTRPNPSDITEVYWLGSSVTTDRLRIEGYVPNSDALFSVSELQAFGSVAVAPAPGAILLCTLGAGLTGWLRRRRTL